MWWAQLLNSISGFLGTGIAAATGAYESIATVSPTTGTSVTFSSIPSTYKSLQIRLLSRNAVASSNDDVNLQFNGDTGANYSRHFLYGTGAAVTAGGAASQTLIRFANMQTGSTAGASMYGAAIFDIHDYASTTVNKTVRVFGGYDANGSGVINLASGAWLSTAAVTSITLSFSGNEVSGSTFALYGIKGA